MSRDASLTFDRPVDFDYLGVNLQLPEICVGVPNFEVRQRRQPLKLIFDERRVFLCGAVLHAEGFEVRDSEGREESLGEINRE